MIVVDCSALVQAHTDPGALGAAVRTRIAKSGTLLAPYLLDVEFASAVLGMARGSRGGSPELTPESLDHALQAYALLPLRRMEHTPLLPRMRELAANMSVYDATYVALAELYEVPLVTCDARIARAGVARCLVEALTSP